MTDKKTITKGESVKIGNINKKTTPIADDRVYIFSQQ